VPEEKYPYPRTYFPGVKDRSEAALITVGDGSKLKGYDLTLPPRLLQRELRINVSWPDGRPAAGALVYYEPTDDHGGSLGERATADRKGFVVIQLFDGLRYVIFAQSEIRGGGSTHSEPILVRVDRKMRATRFVLAKPGTGYEDASALESSPPN
jgi:hypothetical protein